MSIFSTARGNLGQNFSLRTINRDGEPSTVLNFSVASTRYKRQKTADTNRLAPPNGSNANTGTVRHRIWKRC